MYHVVKLYADGPAGAGEWIRAGRGPVVSAVGSPLPFGRVGRPLARGVRPRASARHAGCSSYAASLWNLASMPFSSSSAEMRMPIVFLMTNAMTYATTNE
jgi:hypothetical protein